MCVHACVRGRKEEEAKGHQTHDIQWPIHGTPSHHSGHPFGNAPLVKASVHSSAAERLACVMIGISQCHPFTSVSSANANAVENS